MKTRQYRNLDEFFKANPERSHSWLAKEVGVDRSYISLIRSGERQPSLPVALAIQRATGVDAEGLVTAVA